MSENLHKGAARPSAPRPTRLLCHVDAWTVEKGFPRASQTSTEAPCSASHSGDLWGQESGLCFSGNLLKISEFGTACPLTAFQCNED